MHDGAVYSKEHRWTADDADLADALLAHVRSRRFLSNTEILSNFCEHHESAVPQQTESVWQRLCTQFPHMFAVAAARQELHTLNLDGAHKGSTKGQIPPTIGDALDEVDTRSKKLERISGDRAPVVWTHTRDLYNQVCTRPCRHRHHGGTVGPAARYSDRGYQTQSL